MIVSHYRVLLKDSPFQKGSHLAGVKIIPEHQYPLFHACHVEHEHTLAKYRSDLIYDEKSHPGHRDREEERGELLRIPARFDIRDRNVVPLLVVERNI
ncbi:MAG: hypothetical protein A4E42_02137 [Methanoregulaceae archaeon PtaU1.Bin222]|nr:MAG: hypothetical protein A4E42_02137 [Methanoregulaceae archaeon PtaU1.Bin222]